MKISCSEVSIDIVRHHRLVLRELELLKPFRGTLLTGVYGLYCGEGSIKRHATPRQVQEEKNAMLY